MCFELPLRDDAIVLPIQIFFGLVLLRTRGYDYDAVGDFGGGALSGDRCLEVADRAFDLLDGRAGEKMYSGAPLDLVAQAR